MEQERLERERIAQEQLEQERRRAAYYELVAKAAEQEKIIAQNRGWFGESARTRKTAQAKLAEIQAQLNRDFPNGQP